MLTAIAQKIGYAMLEETQLTRGQLIVSSGNSQKLGTFFGPMVDREEVYGGRYSNSGDGLGTFGQKYYFDVPFFLEKT